MFRLTSKISITNKIGEIFTLDFIENVEISSSWDTMTDTATVELPKNIYVMKDNTPNMVSLAERTIAASDPTGLAEKADKPLFEIGDIIKIELGYDFNYNKVFEGFITDVSATVPIVLKCEDPMWLLGRIKFEDDLENTSPTFAELMIALQKKFILNKETAHWKTIWPELLGITFVPNLIGGLSYTLANFSVRGKTILEIMQALNKEYQLYFYYKLSPEEHLPGIIFCGEYYNINLSQSPKKFHFQNNVISEQLVNQKESIIKRNVKAVNVEDAGSQDANIEVLVGNSDSTSQTTTIEVHKINDAVNKTVGKIGGAIGNAVGGVVGSAAGKAISNNATTLVVKQMLIGIANRKLRTFYYNGYSGYFTTFGKPLVVHGDTVQLIDEYIRDRNGNFKVRQVDYSFGKGGFRQKIYLHFNNDVKEALTSAVSNIVTILS